MKFSIKTILRIIFVLSCANLQAAEPAQQPADQQQQQQRDDTTQNECPICFTGYSDAPAEKSTTLPCGHKFHTDCLSQVTGPQRNHCSYCKQVIDPVLEQAIEREEEVRQALEEQRAEQVGLNEEIERHYFAELMRASTLYACIGGTAAGAGIGLGMTGVVPFLPALAIHAVTALALKTLDGQIFEIIVEQDANNNIRFRTEFFWKRIATNAFFNASAGVILASGVRLAATALQG